ncbi:hypothetical protein [Paenibacillus methanolicus]|uniref:Uncharacterized protein n=1 Tax=Paenibacillus methanolicus TaxID=582686 RepID=A0A5S5BZ67_9BACL|nr:hypothetical protein [Paenibacillus methanolicus]TYP71360.1 hypothetical protein BCM02_110314 [Paenibacillus methanolicus]
MGFDLNANWDTWAQFFQDNWFVLVIALVVLWLVIRIVRTVVKWLIVAVIIVGIIVYSGYTLDDLKSIDLKEIGSTITDKFKEQAISAMAGEAKEATFTNNADGTFTVKSKNVELTGTPGAGEVKVKFQGNALGTWKIDDAIQALITQAKTNG